MQELDADFQFLLYEAKSSKLISLSPSVVTYF